MQETQGQSLGQKDSLEKEMATHSSVLAWEIPWTEEPGGLQSVRSQRVNHDLATKQQRFSQALKYQDMLTCQAAMQPPRGGGRTPQTVFWWGTH